MDTSVEGRTRRRRARLFGRILVVGGGVLLSGGVGGGRGAIAQLPKINPDGLTSSAVCGECHQAIHAVWQGSLHASAWSNNIFQAGYHRAVEAAGEKAARVCLSCHAPTVRHTGDYAVRQPITAEGITCDFCHSVRDVDLTDPRDPVRLVVGKTKYGPLRHAQSPAHEIVNSPLHTRSEFCAACHEYRNPNGVLVLGTYSEWKAGPYAKRGKQCQDCHMPLVSGRVVAVKIKEDAPKSVNLHDISGSHDLERVRKAVKLKLEGTEWFGKRVWVHLKVANEGSGHCFPTGLPMHRAFLEVVLREGNKQVDRREIPFELVTVDTKGRVIQREHDVFLNAARIRSDTRLRPEETREVEVAFRDISAAKLQVSASLYYAYTTETLVIQRGEKRFEPAEMKFLVASVKKTLRKPGR
ncbi:MAG: multiheme c-type cytochrome [Phycisphaerae bacterium]